MLKFKFDKNERIFSDGIYCSNGSWICDLRKVPLGELLMEHIDIVCGEGNQLRLVEQDPITPRNFSKIIPNYGDIEMRNSGFLFKSHDKKSYRMLINIENGLIAFINEEYVKIFSDCTVESVTTNGQGKMIQFRDAEEEFIYGVMPVELEDELNSIFQLISRAKLNKMWQISAELNRCVEDEQENEDGDEK